MKTAMEWQALINGPHRKKWNFTIDGKTDYNVESANIIYDAYFQTRGQIDLRLAGAAPIDARASSPIVVTIDTYRADGTLFESTPMGTFYIRNSDNGVIRAFTKEILLLDGLLSVDEVSGGTYGQWITKRLTDALPTTVTIPGLNRFVDWDDTTWSLQVPVDRLRDTMGKRILDHIDQVLGAVGRYLHVGRDNRFRISNIEREALIDTYPLLDLQPRSGNPDTDFVYSDVPTFNREEWYNQVILRYWWDNGIASQDIRRGAKIAGSSPYTPELVGQRTYYADINGGATEAEVTERARTMLLNLAKGATIGTLEAVARPDMTAGGGILKNNFPLLIRRVQFDMLTDRMTLTYAAYEGSVPTTTFTV